MYWFEGENLGGLFLMPLLGFANGCFNFTSLAVNDRQTENLFLLSSYHSAFLAVRRTPLPPSDKLSLGEELRALSQRNRNQPRVCLCLRRAAEAVLKGQVETIVSFHIQNISNSKADRSTAPVVCGWELE